MRLYKIVALGVLVFCFAIVDKVLAVPFMGTLDADDDVKTFMFTITEIAEITLQTRSYAGGILAAGTPDETTINPGGFDPILSLFDSTGFLIAENDDGTATPGNCTVATDSSTGEALDACLVALLTPDTYTVAITQFSNFAGGITLLDGFTPSDPFTGEPILGDLTTFTADFGCTNGQFCDFFGNDRESFFAFDLTISAPQQPIPEPGTWVLLGSGLIGLIAYGRRRQVRAH